MVEILFTVSEEVRAAIAGGRAVVALESTLLAHGLPWPENLEVGRAAEAAVRAEGAVPATVAVLRGALTIGVDGAALERIARGEFVKAGQADLAPAVATGRDAATTVSATAFAAARAGIALFATGGIGGVHRGDTGDVSSDLATLAREPVTVVSAGAKAVLDLPRTVEMLETLGVLVLGYGTSEFPAFYTRSSGIPLEHRVDDPAGAAAVILARRALGDRGGVLIVNPIPAEDALDTGEIREAISAALASAARGGIGGKALTPHLLASVARATGGKSLAANRALVLNNCRIAARIAVALAGV
ncbi:MAG: pseudouridine-5'-phosphate glycosidase [Myxococcales bacterium]|nr:pseudouridine-5'-phosphate glycosidase [Myxococcales bacterium]